MSNEPSSAPAADLRPDSAGIGATTGTLLIVANMIGVGVFTTTGYMIGALQSPPAVLIAWLVGGVAAFCGALAYAELGSAIPRNGGEYQLLSRIYHPAVGFVAGWVSLIVGFAAPLAAFAMKFGEYLAALGCPLPPVVSASPAASTAPSPSTPTVRPALPLTDAENALASTAGGGSWKTFEPGKMPAGRLIGTSDLKEVADRGLAGERYYLRGQFVVNFADANRAVLRPRTRLTDAVLRFGGSAKSTRIIVEFPAGYSPPAQGSEVILESRGSGQ
jgi:hypothetical protein